MAYPTKEWVASLKVGDTIRIAEREMEAGEIVKVTGRNSRGQIKAGHHLIGVWGHVLTKDYGSKMIFPPETSEQVAARLALEERDRQLTERQSHFASIQRKLSTYERPRDFYSFDNEMLADIDSRLQPFDWSKKSLVTDRQACDSRGHEGD